MLLRPLLTETAIIRAVKLPQVSTIHQFKHHQTTTRSFSFIKKKHCPGMTKRTREVSTNDSPSSSSSPKLPEESKPKLPKSDIPSLKPRWFYATDNPISMPKEYRYVQKDEAKKFAAFTEFDSDRIEKQFQLLNKHNGDNETLTKNDKFKIPVNEDYLFEVDLVSRKMYPVYWDGAIYEVRRGVWFDADGHPLRESLSDELERGYAKFKPYYKKVPEKNRTIDPKDTENNNISVKNEDGERDIHELHGFKEGKLVVYSEDKTAYILNELYGGKLQIGYLKGLQNGPALGANRVIRGFQEFSSKNSKDEKSSSLSLSNMFELELSQMFGEKTKTSTDKSDSDNTKQAMEIEIKEDYNIDQEDGTTDKGREIDHLIFCVHGIGQSLGTRFQGVNFIHTINILRKNIKKVYEENKDFQKLLNNDKNCRIQVLPISWRHKIDFSTHEPFEDRDDQGNYRLPTLNDITMEEMKPLRNLLGSVILDVLLYYEPLYFNQILDEVTKEANQIYHTFKKRNPSFNGKISIIGHSLGSAISFDILSQQPKSLIPKDHKDRTSKHLDFKVDNYFALGSPIGVFNLLKRKNIGSVELHENSNEKISVPRCENFYNVFHPCDPVGYRVEPLISPEFKKFQPESIPFLIENFNKQLSSFAELSENLSNKFIGTAADAWSNVTANVGSKHVEKMLKTASESATPDILKDDDHNLKLKKIKLTDEQLSKLSSLNYNGRVDYELKQGYFDVSIISSISAHISYFEDENVAGFILKEILAKHERVKEKSAKILVEKGKNKNKDQ
ncbi:putative phospholipase, mitochondrial [Wickerhamomyces ciferrii]|uniref:Phospholipase, mitochondrial n=1 Tax=Wickerhamomyces ciferrii (strain ATCC 14091 / BCRC 22168 / CBS 111 / JCM 3599 / NBRC 0793 / NRRL Y-1031 F-60-10) TaxID=1206466 RepID=K0KP46_WICCF|nr:putative phospholipase, mitochondrial [Wickerhamomyces ciferrii]CCH43967.1 putative phospholipase, mitochondrial [Wickerhamomyces ciferrii]